MVVTKNGGCAFGKVSRNMIENIGIDFKDHREEMRDEFTEMKKVNTNLYNHLSDRLPKWAVIIGGAGLTIFGIILGSLVNHLLG